MWMILRDLHAILRALVRLLLELILILLVLLILLLGNLRSQDLGEVKLLQSQEPVKVNPSSGNGVSARPMLDLSPSLDVLWNVRVIGNKRWRESDPIHLLLLIRSHLVAIVLFAESIQLHNLGLSLLARRPLLRSQLLRVLK
jgi:hypothetical protein